MDTPILRVIAQRYDMDCGVAVLAMATGLPYENALCAIAQEVPDVCVVGCWTEHLERAARHLGFRLRRRRRFDVEEDCGILNVSSKRWKNDHLVVLWDGRIIDTDFGLYRPDVYLAVNQAKPTLLLVVEPM